MRQPTRAPFPLETGDIMPRLALSGPRGEVVDTSAPPMAGRINLLVFAGPNNAANSAVLSALAERRARLEAVGGRCFLITRTASGATPRGAAPLPGLGGGTRPSGPGLMPMAGGLAPATDIGELKAGAMRLADGTGDAFRLAGVPDDAPALIAIGANLHVIDVIRETVQPGRIDDLLAAVEHRSSSRNVITPVMHPPVLAVPDVFSPADNARLIEIFHTRGQEFVEPGHSALGSRTTDCKMRIPDLGRQDRVDHWVVETDTQALITGRLQARLFPEIRKAFNYSVTRHERYRIARYEGRRGGEAMGHRDNVDPSVAHRRFAVTINLNAEDYEGAELRFPEYSDQLYKPGSGTAIVFSCSLLHEVVAMRSGSRFAMLAFLFGET